MRNLFKTIGIIALVAIMGTMAGCSKGGGSGKASPASDFVYDTDGAGGVVITRYIGKGGNVVIPAEIEGLPVTQLGVEAFAGVISKIEDLGDTITDKGETGPGHKITSIVIPKSVWLIGNRCFRKNSALKSVTFIGDIRPYEKGKLMTNKYLQIGQGDDYKVVGGWQGAWFWFGVFEGCENLKSVTFMGSPVIISSRAFLDCTNLDELNFPDVEDDALWPFWDVQGEGKWLRNGFEGCTKLPMATKEKLRKFGFTL